MTAAGQVVSVRRATDDTAECRRCGQPIERGHRIAFVAGTGNVHLRCLLDHDQADDTSQGQDANDE